MVLVKGLGVADFARYIIAIDVWLLQKHVQAPFVLSEWMASDSERHHTLCFTFLSLTLTESRGTSPLLINEALQSGSPFLDESLFVYAVVVPER